MSTACTSADVGVGALSGTGDGPVLSDAATSPETVPPSVCGASCVPVSLRGAERVDPRTGSSRIIVGASPISWDERDDDPLAVKGCPIEAAVSAGVWRLEPGTDEGAAAVATTGGEFGIGNVAPAVSDA